MRPRILSTIGMLALLGVGLGACAGPVGGPGWGGPGYYSGYPAGPGYYPGVYTAPRYHPGFYTGPGDYGRRYADRYRALPPQELRRPERQPAPRTEHWSQERLRRHWCSQPGAGC